MRQLPPAELEDELNDIPDIPWGTLSIRQFLNIDNLQERKRKGSLSTDQSENSRRKVGMNFPAFGIGEIYRKVEGLL